MSSHKIDMNLQKIAEPPPSLPLKKGEERSLPLVKGKAGVEFENNLRHQKMAEHLHLYLVTDRTLCGVSRGTTKQNFQQLLDTVCQAIDGGVTIVQLRDKVADDDELYAQACALKEAINGRVPLLMNDHVQIAKKAGLDGAHIGQTDLNVSEARQILGNEAWLGLSVNSSQQMQEMVAKHARYLDYIGVGPVFATNTKPDHAPPFGIDGVRPLITQSPLPSVAIGGIDASTAQAIRNTGVDGIAVVSAICASDNPKAMANQLA